MKSLSRFIVALCTLFVMAGCTTPTVVEPSTPSSQPSTPRRAGATQYIDRVMRGGKLSFADGTTLVFRNGGRITGAAISATNLKIVPDGDAVALDGCTFSGSIVDSRLSAANLGFVADMKDKSLSYTYKGKKVNTRERTGTDNTRQWTQLAQLLSGSRNVRVDFGEGKYYNAAGTSFVKITAATGLELCGGTVIMGLRLLNCSNVDIHDMRFVGYQAAHDFPPLVNKAGATSGGVTYTAANAFVIDTDRMRDMGLAGDAIWLMTDGTKTSSGFNVRNCHFEMRQNGLVAGERGAKLTVSDVTCTACTASHIFYQPIGLHARNVTVSGMVADYCLQGVDISTCSSSVRIVDSRFTRCSTGPKQETTPEFHQMTRNNAIDRCYFGITDDYLRVDGSTTILNIAEGAPDDVFTVSNTTFDVKSQRTVGSVKCRTARMVLDNVTLNLDIQLPRGTTTSGMNEVFSIFGGTAASPVFEMHNVTVNVAAGTVVNDLCFPHVGGKEMTVIADGLKVAGNGTVKNAYFDVVSDVNLTGCSLALPANYVAQSVKRLEASGSDFAKTKCFFSASEGSTLRINGNTIKTDKVVSFSASPKLVEVSGNAVDLTGAEAFAGINDNVRLTSSNFKVSGNTFKRANTGAKVLPASASRYNQLVKNNTVK